MLEDDTATKPSVILTSDALKNWGIALGIAATLFGVIKFAVTKVDDYDTYAIRIAKLEARDTGFTALTDASKQAVFMLDMNKNDLAALKLRIDNLSADVVTLRISYERLKALQENKR
jgi:CRISPR/Cas system-associated endoribonuclease Cas2